MRSLGFLVTVLPLACWGTTEKLLGLFGLSFLLCKVSGGGHMISALSDQPSWEQRCNEHLAMPPQDSVPGAEEAATNTRKPLPSEGFHFSVECSPLPLPLKSPPKLPQTILSTLSISSPSNYSPTLCKPCSCFNHSQERTLTNTSNYLAFTTSNRFLFGLHFT